MALAADTDLAFAGAARFAELVRAREVRPRELVEMCLRRIEALDPHLNAFRTTMPERALAEADAREGHGGPLAGVPIAVKDDLPVEGEAMTWGSRTYGPPQPADAEAVRRLRAAGAIPVGITNVPELMVFPWTASEANGVTRNPWDRERTTGGSSGGTAAAVAAGLVPAGTGSDGGGSIRIPAACCGLVGMKPTRGRVSTQPARWGWLGLSVYGGLARTIADSALLLDAMSGAVAGDEDCAPDTPTSFAAAAAAPPGRLRIAMSKKTPPGGIAPLSGDQARAWERTGEILRELGHEVVERDPRYGSASIEWMQTWLRAVHEDALTVPDPARLERATRRMSGLGRRLVPPARRDALLARRPATTARILALWDDVDVLVTPALAKTAIAAEGGWRRPLPLAIDTAARFSPYTPVFNLTGQPAMTLPAGRGADGLPLSVQLVGRHGAEGILYSLGAQLEQARPWAQERPPLS